MNSPRKFSLGPAIHALARSKERCGCADQVGARRLKFGSCHISSCHDRLFLLSIPSASHYVRSRNSWRDALPHLIRRSTWVPAALAESRRHGRRRCGRRRYSPKSRTGARRISGVSFLTNDVEGAVARLRPSCLVWYERSLQGDFSDSPGSARGSPRARALSMAANTPRAGRIRS
jgi:hypothetical protein